MKLGHPNNEDAPPGGRPARGRTLGAGIAAAIVVAGGAVLLAGCAASGGSHASGAPSGTCTKVSAVLSDGPTPRADPVGYAEAQILPLGRLRLADRSLEAAITDLDQAYKDLYTSNGSAAASKAVKADGARIDALCPGATP